MTEALVTPRPDTTEMTSVHKVFREAFARAPELVGSVESGSVERAAVVGSFYANVLELLRVHHGGEDDLLYPKLLERCADEAALIGRINAQHHDVDSGLDDARTRLAAWTLDPTGDRAAELAASLATLSAQLTPHLDEEELDILPLCDRCISTEEWDQLPGHALGGFQGDKIWLAIGLIYEAMTPAQQEYMLAHMPPPVVEFWNSVGRQQFDAFMADLG